MESDEAMLERLAKSGTVAGRDAERLLEVAQLLRRISAREEQEALRDEMSRGQCVGGPPAPVGQDGEGTR